MQMMNKNSVPIPPALQQQLRVMQHDLHQVRANLAVGRISPQQFPDLERVLDSRLKLLEAEVHARLLDEARRTNARFKMN